MRTRAPLPPPRGPGSPPGAGSGSAPGPEGRSLRAPGARGVRAPGGPLEREAPPQPAGGACRRLSEANFGKLRSGLVIRSGAPQGVGAGRAPPDRVQMAAGARRASGRGGGGRPGPGCLRLSTVRVRVRVRRAGSPWSLVRTPSFPASCARRSALSPLREARGGRRAARPPGLQGQRHSEAAVLRLRFRTRPQGRDHRDSERTRLRGSPAGSLRGFPAGGCFSHCITC